MYSLGRVEGKEDRVLKFEMPLFILLNKCSFSMQVHILMLSHSIGS